MVAIGLLMVRPRTPQAQDDSLEIEADAADLLGLDVLSLALEDVVDGELDLALDELPEADGRPLLYRGWMLTAEEHESLYEALADRGYELTTSPDEYERACYLPRWYEAIAESTAASVWTWGHDLDDAWELAHTLGEPPWMLKDHVKSAKERWAELGTIPAGCSRERFDQICSDFIDHRGDRFERGLCFRRMLPLRRLGVSDRGMPVHDEHRIYFWQGRPVASAPQHELEGSVCDVGRFASLGRRIRSPFFTADVARLDDGSWMVVEIGDGGVSMLPPTLDPRDLFDAMELRP